MFEIKIDNEPYTIHNFDKLSPSYSIVDADGNVILEISSEDYFNGLSVLESITSILNKLQELGYLNGKN